jgi:hypothetical protein
VRSNELPGAIERAKITKEFVMRARGNNAGDGDQRE